MLKIIKINNKRYKLTEDSKTLGLIEYSQTLEVMPSVDAQILIDDSIFYIRRIMSEKALREDYIIKLTNNLNTELASFSFSVSTVGSGIDFSFENILIQLNGINYHLGSKSNILQKIFPLTSCSSVRWFDSNNYEQMHLKIEKGVFSTKEVLVKTHMDISDINTKLLALWGFYILPGKNQRAFFPVMLVVIIFLLMINFIGFIGFLFNKILSLL